MARGVNTKANGIDFRANRFDEFLKLIPQNLTATEKAQVMANLGITPTPGSLDGAVRYDAAQTLTDEQKQQAQENAGVDKALADKANIDGYYSQLTAGAAENLVGGNETSREFTEDTAGGTADIADGSVKIDRIKGNTIVWNQIIVDGDCSVRVPRGTLSAVGAIFSIEDNSLKIVLGNSNYSGATIVGTGIVGGHKYYVSVEVKASVDMTNVLAPYLTNAQASPKIPSLGTSWVKSHTIFSYVAGDSIGIARAGVVGTDFNEGDILYARNVQYIDLTKMFGEGNEPATPEEFEKMFPLDYYNYNTGQLLSLNPTGIKTVGFNAYNHATSKASVIGGKQYQITGAYTSITEGDTTITPDEDGLFTPTKNGELTIVGGNSTTTCVHLVWSGVRNGEYEEHWEETRNIPIAQINTDGTITESAAGKTRLFPGGLCSAGSVHDEITPAKAIMKIGKVDLGSLVWTISNEMFYASLQNYGIIDKPGFNNLNNIKTAIYETKPYSHVYSHSANKIIGQINKDIFIYDNDYTTAAEFKAVMNGVYLYYELATPIEVIFAEPLNLTYRVSDFGTETLLPINTATPVTTPIRLDVVYGLNVVDFVRNADKNYLTIEDSTGDNGSSFTNLRSALSTAFGIYIVPTYDSTNKRYTFAISDNRKVEVPSSATASGLKGTWAEDETAVYFCTEADTWVKINKETW